MLDIHAKVRKKPNANETKQDNYFGCHLCNHVCEYGNVDILVGAIARTMLLGRALGLKVDLMALLPNVPQCHVCMACRVYLVLHVPFILPFIFK